MKNILTKAKYLGLSLVVLCSLSGQAECMQSYTDSLRSERVESTLKRLHQEAEIADKPLMQSPESNPYQNQGVTFLRGFSKWRKKTIGGYIVGMLQTI